MLFIKCPYCGEKREEEEFTYSDEAFLVRPLEPESLSDEEWAEYLFARKNTKGSDYERWSHTAGCRKFFIIKRNNIDYKIEKILSVEEAMRDYKASSSGDNFRKIIYTDSINQDNKSSKDIK